MKISTRTIALTVVAVAIGLAIAWMDSRPRWDDTGVTVGALLVTSFVMALISGRRPWLWALLVGVWTPLVELVGGGELASLVALAVAGVGAAGGYLSARALALARD